LIHGMAVMFALIIFKAHFN